MQIAFDLPQMTETLVGTGAADGDILINALKNGKLQIRSIHVSNEEGQDFDSITIHGSFKIQFTQRTTLIHNFWLRDFLRIEMGKLSG